MRFDSYFDRVSVPPSVMRRAFLAAAALGAVAGSGMLQAQGFPSRNVSVVVPFPPAGGADTLARILSGPLSAAWKQSVVVENRPGAAGKIGASSVARAPADGHTLLMASTGAIDKDNVHAFAPVALVSASPYVVVVHPSVGVRSIGELIAKARSAPGALSFGSSGEGAASHLSAELFKQVAGVDMLHVPYKGTGQAVTDLLAGNIQVMFSPAQAVMAHVASGKLVALAVTSPRRARAFPALPTVAESGVPGYAATGWFGLFVAAATPRPVVARLSADVQAALANPEVAKAMLAAGAEPAPGTPEEFGRFVQDEMSRWAKVEDQLARQKQR